MDAVALFLDPQWVSLWVTGTALLLLAIVLFVLDVSNKAQRVFALLLALRGLTFFLGPLRAEAESVRGSVLWASLAPYTIIPFVPLVIAFLSLYPRRRGLGLTRWGLPLLLAVTLGLESWYLLDHGAYAVVNATRPATYGGYGPLFLLTGLRLPAFAFAGFVLAKDYRNTPRGALGFSLFLMVTAFTLNGLYDGTLATLELWHALEEPGTEWGDWGWTRWWLPVLALPISLGACMRLFPVLRRAGEDPELQEIVRFFLVALPVAILSAFVRELPWDNADRIAGFVQGIWRLAIPLLLAYALMRYQLFGIDIHLKAGVRRAVVLGAFTVTFFLVSEAAESLAEGDRGPAIGIASAGVLSLASRPVQGFAARASDRLMPDTKPIAQQTYAERLRFYLDQYLLIRHDGEVTTKERHMLAKLQQTLSLPDDVVQDLERRGALPSEPENLAPGPVIEGQADSRLELAIKGTLATGAMALLFGMLSQGIEAVIPLSNQAAGLIAAAAVSFLLGPLEGLADRLTHRLDPAAATDAKDEAERRQAFAAALTTAFEDGSLSRRDLEYLASLQERLRIPLTTRWRLERQARRQSGRAMAPTGVPG